MQTTSGVSSSRSRVWKRLLRETRRSLWLDASVFLSPYTVGSLFSTDHHTTEALTPMYHFDKVGFKIQITTQDGARLTLEDIAETLDGRATVFVPGGHDPTIDFHSHESSSKLHQSANAKGLNTISLCPGPSALHADEQRQITLNFDCQPGYLSKDYPVVKVSALKSLRCQHSHAFWYSLALLTSLFQIYRVTLSPFFGVHNAVFNAFQSSQFSQSPLTDRLKKHTCRGERSRGRGQRAIRGSLTLHLREDLEQHLCIKVLHQDAYRRDHGPDRKENRSSEEAAAHRAPKQTTHDKAILAQTIFTRTFCVG